MINTESPLPWEYDSSTERVIDAKNHTVMNDHGNYAIPVSPKDQQAIVTAVNCHDELLEALKATALLLEYQNNYHGLNTTGLLILSQAKAAIAKALNQQQ